MAVVAAVAAIVFFGMGKTAEAAGIVSAIVTVFCAIATVFGLMWSKPGRRVTPSGSCRVIPPNVYIDPIDLGVKAPIDYREHGLTDYVPREVNEQIATVVTGGGAVLVRGPAAAGKTRSALAMIVDHRDRRTVLVPEHDFDLSKLIGRRNVIIWLDDIQDYFGPHGLNLDLMKRLTTEGRDVSVVATIQDKVSSEYTGSLVQSRSVREQETLYRPGAKLLQLWPGQVLELSPYLTDHESLDAAQIESKDSRIHDARLSSDGFGAYLVAGPQLMHRWTTVHDALSDLGAAVISAAVDARSAGYHQPLSADLLENLAAPYVSPARRNRANLPTFVDVLEWATTPILGASACLDHLHTNNGRNSGYRAPDFLLDRTNNGHGPLFDSPVKDHIWQPLIDHATPAEVFDIGSAAYTAGQLDHGQRAFEKAANAGYDEAMHNLGVILWEVGEVEAAKSWYKRAAANGYSRAMFNLGVVLTSLGDIDAAKYWYKQTADTGNADAMVNLGVLLATSGDFAAAKYWYQQAVATGHDDAMVNLGLLFLAEGDVEAAKSSFERAAAAGNADAKVNLGLLLDQVGQVEVAKSLYEQAAASGHAGAMFNLGVMLVATGGVSAAKWLLEHVTTTLHTEVMVSVGVLLLAFGDNDATKPLLEKAADTGNANAMVNLGVLLRDSGEIEVAKTWFERAAAAGNTGGTVKLGLLFLAEGDVEAAKSSFERAAAAGNADAKVNLGVLLGQAGDAEAAKSLFEEAAAAGHTVAMNNLGVLLSQAGDAEAAKSWYDQAAAAGNIDAADALHRLDQAT